MSTKDICGRCGGRIVRITEEGTKVVKSYGVDRVNRVYCQHCDDIPNAKAIEESDK